MCVLKSVREHSVYIQGERTLGRERDFRVSLVYYIARIISFPLRVSCVRVRLFLPRAWPDECKPSTTACSSFASHTCLPCPPVLDRPATPANSCRHPVLFALFPREKSTRDRYLRGKMARRLSLCYIGFFGRCHCENSDSHFSRWGFLL